ncbi:MAG: hypothetical protein H7Z76_16165 [Methylotenera sp.]|nr:hypothetical protein [Flavobacterium sp.]
MTKIIIPPLHDVQAELCKRSFEYYIKYIQKEFHGYKPNLYKFQLEIVQVLEKVLKGEITRLIINIPPRYRKTEIAVKMFISYCLAMNQKAKFIHLSYSDDLALDNSESIKDIVYSDCFQNLFPMRIKKDSKSKKKWYTEKGGGVYATSAGGQVTGFGAGKSIEEYGIDDLDDEEINSFFLEFPQNNTDFGGAIIIDDPNKPEDANSNTVLKRINERFDSTIKNRANSRYTPIIIIQQRTSPNDMSGFLLEQSNEWHHLNLKALKDDGTALCDKFHTVEELLKIKERNENVFNNQYQQDPKPLEGLMYAIEKVDAIDTSKGIKIATGDPADDGKCYMASVFATIHSNRIWVYDILYTQDGSDDTKDIEGNVIKKGTISRNIELAKEHKPMAFWFEKNGLGNTYAKSVKDKYSLVQTFNSKGSKDERIFDKAYIISKYFRFYKTSPHNEYAKAIKSMDYYKREGGNEFKDIQDALTSLAEIAIKNNLINIYV